MKQRFSSLDVKVIAHELSTALQNLRLTNVYDLSSRIFLFKFARPDNKQQLVVDSGFRCHLTTYQRATAAAPSAFVTRLRKFLRTRRVTAVDQVGTDRVIELQFSDGQYRLFFEFYAGGNIILTDGELKILALLRIVSPGFDQEELRAGLVYSLSNRQNYDGIPAITQERAFECLQRAADAAADEAQVTATPAKKGKKRSGDALKRALSTIVPQYPPVLIDHSLLTAGFDPETTPLMILQDDALIEHLMRVLQQAEKVANESVSNGLAEGYIIAKPEKRNPQNKLAHDAQETERPHVYEDFQPFRPQQFVDDPAATLSSFTGFNRTVDEFFSSIEAQKLQSRLQDRENAAQRKLEAARQDQQGRLGTLQGVQALNVRKAQAIEANVQRVEEAVDAVNGLIGQGMDWADIARLIEMEQRRHNTVAETMKLPLKLYENTATLLLGELEEENQHEEAEADETDSDVSDDEKPSLGPATKSVDRRITVDIDLGLSAWANARQYYDQKRSAAVKELKTLESSSKALKSTERKVAADLKKGLKQEKEVLRPVRQQFWFEKFLYFVSSDGYLVLGGKDVQQNDILYKRYLKRGDIFVHAEIPGASPMLIKNNAGTPEAPIPPSTLTQAGNYCLSTSSAWDSKEVMSAWWVNADQVSKIAPSGDFLGPGNFYIKRAKNFLPPAQLLLGFSVMFQISDESKAQHVKHRRGGIREEESKTESDLADRITQAIDKSEAEQEASAESEDRVDPGTTLQEQDSPGNSEIETSSQNAGENQSSDVEEPSGDEPDVEDIDHSEFHHNNPLQPGKVPSSRQGTPREEESINSDAEDETGVMARGQPATTETSSADAGLTKDQHETRSGVRHLSAKERKLLRATKTTGSQDERTSQPSEDGHSEPKTPEHDQPASQAPSIASSSQPSSNPQGRGKRGKRKKMITKYAAQDDEDRALAMRLLGSAAAQQKAADEVEAKKRREEETAFQKQRRREQHVRAAAEGLKHEEARRRRDGEAGEGTEHPNEDNEDEDETHSLELLSSFVATPLPSDDILAAIPLCAPWSALARHKYKIKLQPGPTKKGKAVKEILSRWTFSASGGNDKERKKMVDETSTDVERFWPREVELIRGWRDVEVVGVVPVKGVKIMMAGGGGGGAEKKKGGGRGGRGGKRK
ncbi:MAG: hypothetical protein M1817_002145 [Caeruleum heppii]|nr:MAG: hypothetical protein M1817_002145 [Caeruleum heppii]